jgi:hypothetical protein
VSTPSDVNGRSAVDEDTVRRIVGEARQAQTPQQREAAERTEYERVLATERMRRKARREVDREEAPELVWWDLDDLLDSPSPQYLVADFLYVDALSRLYGAPGAGKSFVALDWACHVALGRDWYGRQVVGGPVVYVMAEGQAVNKDRLRAWCNHHRAPTEQLRGRFVAVPHAVPLTPESVQPLAARVRELQPKLIILDTKNAMMAGDENSASDFAVMRRAMDELRRAAGGACVLLIDHTGYSEAERARGTSAGIAAMETEVLVKQGDGGAVQAEVTRDKAAAPGSGITFELRSAAPAAVLVHDVTLRPPTLDPEDWAGQPIPLELATAEGTGAKHLASLARFMAKHAEGDRARHGQTRAEALKAIGLNYADSSGQRAWSRLAEGGWITPAEGVKAPTGRHVWARRDEAE